MSIFGRSDTKVVIRDNEMNTGFLLSFSNDKHLFSSLLEHAPFLVWVTDSRGRLRYANNTWLEFTGRPLEAELGDGWLANVHAEDLEAKGAAFRNAAGSSMPFRSEYRLRRADGVYRWMVDEAQPIFGGAGELVGYFGCCTDVTDRKNAEQARHELSLKLVEAQEAERTRIGRELHDDIGQELAILCMQMHRAGQPVSDRPGTVHPTLRELATKARAVADKVSKLSHQLHSSHLEFLGFSAAAKAACREFADRRKIPVECTCEDIPAQINGLVALGFLRVLQEALHNIDKHSEARNVAVNITGTASEIRMQIVDDGRGFEVNQAGLAAGLGLISMRERITLLGGHFQITSAPGAGTHLEARAPITEVARD